MLDVMREVQVPLLAVLLIGGCAAKARHAIGARSIDAGIGPTAMFPLRLRRPVGDRRCARASSASAPACCSPRAAPGRAGPRPRSARRPALLFGTAVAALHELRARTAGCGLRLLRRAEPHAGELAGDHAGGAAVRGRARLDRRRRRCAWPARPGRHG